MSYKIYDSVEDEIRYFENFEELKDYADLWKSRLNDEVFEYESRYSTNTYKEVENIFEVCNIKILEIE